MLILTRKKSQTIHIGDNIVVSIVSVDGKSVRVAIDAPKTTPVLRGELVREAA